MYLLDTNVLILGIKGSDPDKTFLEKALAQRKVYISIISVAEFLSQASEDAESKFNQIIENFPILLIDLETAKLAAEYRKKFLKTKRVQLLDYFLAAQAKLNDLILVTHNKSDFPMRDIKVITP